MPKLYSSKHIAKVLQNKDFFYISQKGSHAKFQKIGKASIIEKEGTAFIDLALTPKSAQRLYEQLGHSLEDWKQSQEK